MLSCVADLPYGDFSLPDFCQHGLCRTSWCTNEVGPTKWRFSWHLQQDFPKKIGVNCWVPCRFNPSTGERRWTKPPLPPPSLPVGWAAAQDPSSGQHYYYNASTGLCFAMTCSHSLPYISSTVHTANTFYHCHAFPQVSFIPQPLAADPNPVKSHMMKR